MIIRTLKMVIQAMDMERKILIYRKRKKEMLLRHGIPMDSVYTAKAYEGMKKYLDDKDIKNSDILFIHTGGTPLFFDDLKMIRI